ncbi:MAG: hypothetical protein F9K29_05475 [Hyphomicrobiaceae bacterium]|nr:MAG: hypothetical protein F9K29_05475 [Hyphomicrobiaceae bacterium]
MKFQSRTVVALACALSLAATTNASAHGLGIFSGASTATAPETNVTRIKDRTGRNIGIGLGILGTAIILSEAARAEGRRRYSRDSYCGRLLYRCEDGHRWSCERYEDRCM